jgi:transposase
MSMGRIPYTRYGPCTVTIPVPSPCFGIAVRPTLARAVQRYLASHPGIVTAEFPGYAPELNPDEQVWTHLKGHTLANYAPPCLAMLRTRLEQEASTLRKRVDLLAAFIKHTKLPLRL